MFFEVVCFGWFLIIFLCFYGKPPFQYCAKYTLLVCLYQLYAVVVLPINLLRPFNNKNQSDLWRLWTSPAIPVGIKFRVKGIENITDKKSVLVMFNHQTGLDLVGFWGLITYLSGCIYVDRSKGKESMQAIRTQVDKVKRTKSKILFAPEGTRNDSGTLLPFKAGGFRIAIENQLPILPVVVSPYSSFQDGKKKIFTNGRIIIKVLPEIPTSGLTVEDLDELRNKTRNVMAETFEELREEIKKESEQPICIWTNFFSYDF